MTQNLHFPVVDTYFWCSLTFRMWHFSRIWHNIAHDTGTSCVSQVGLLALACTYVLVHVLLCSDNQKHVYFLLKGARIYHGTRNKTASDFSSHIVNKHVTHTKW